MKKIHRVRAAVVYCDGKYIALIPGHYSATSAQGPEFAVRLVARKYLKGIGYRLLKAVRVEKQELNVETWEIEGQK
jgi:hypothetical protein